MKWIFINFILVVVFVLWTAFLWVSGYDFQNDPMYCFFLMLLLTGVILDGGRRK